MILFSTKLQQKNTLKAFQNNQVKNSEQTSQMEKILGKEIVNIAIVDQNAYWVYNNTFYTAEIDNDGMIDTDNAKPVDVFSLSKNQTNKLLKILDSLKD